MKEFGLQLWSIRDEFRDKEHARASFKTIAGYGYTQAQTAGAYDFVDPAEFRRYADDAGVKIVGTHYKWDRIKNDIPGTVAYHRALGTDEIGIGGYGAKTMDELRAFIKTFNELGKIYHKEGFVLSIHNHMSEFSNEFKVYEGKTRYDHMLDELDPETVKFNLDAGWAQMAGMDVRALIEKMAGRINILHVKDVQAQYYYGDVDGEAIYGPQRIEVGRGNMNYKGIIETAEKCGVKYFIVEDEFYSTGNPLESVKMSADYVKSHLLEK